MNLPRRVDRDADAIPGHLADDQANVVADDDLVADFST
jgi:hypothetical protein